jgi:EAL domain-containing protein (putative c-di-GMP-specific phosphodiesterase class I)
VVEVSLAPARRVVVELTERREVADYGQLDVALTHLRRPGLRIAVGDAGAGFASMRHILELKPDMIKLDRNIVAGIDANPGSGLWALQCPASRRRSALSWSPRESRPKRN